MNIRNLYNPEALNALSPEMTQKLFESLEREKAKAFLSYPEGTTDFEEAKEQLRRLYALEGATEPEFVCGSLPDVVNKAIDTLLASGCAKADVEPMMDDAHFDCLSRYGTIAVLDVVLQNDLAGVLLIPKERAQVILSLMRLCSVVYLFDTHAFIGGKPTGVYTNDSGEPVPVWTDAAWAEKQAEMQKAGGA